MCGGSGEQEYDEQVSEEAFNAVEALMEYEDGVLTFDEEVALFQNLVDTGMAWQLQGSYGRTATNLIEAGFVTAPEGLR